MYVCTANAATQNNCKLQHIKIVAIGDSVTQGGYIADEYSYRLALSKLLKQENYHVDFIGMQKAGFNPSFKWPADFDNEHQGFYGATTLQVQQSLIIDLLKLTAPDFALIHLGNNDLGSLNAIKSVVLPMHAIILQLREHNPNVRILISQLHLNGYTAKYIRLHLDILAFFKSNLKSPILMVPHYKNWQDIDTFDGMHPSISGQHKMAKAWFDSFELLCIAN
ncbi:GDSL-type esterase/lipase family protein [Methylotenera sp.]|uniref:GDSL-type esterase/lipase family protein n=1 Tax=Methylotenera sp. TaxID=2051956 RepID=UPI00272AF5E7|nr:GDSL-type esterase/lipase family protein [Methylotenera sp.]MDP2070409.1 GDSL-type esterase/lipase family protein [Methylotenera sp.]MDP3006581.1 GDSL-type esterase/lipase family protein [Methylotenera sp.]